MGLDALGKPPSPATYRHCSVPHSHHLMETAGLVTGRQGKETAPRLDPVGQGVVKSFPESEPVREAPLQCREELLVPFRPAAKKDPLRGKREQPLGRRLDQVEALLLGQTRNDSKQRLVRRRWKAH